MKRFYKAVDYKSRKDMVAFLTKHFRYDTLNYWNRATSYANDVKIYNLGLTSEQADKLYRMLDIDEAYVPFTNIVDNFGAKYDYRWQAHFNGRSGGYLVLYSGKKKKSQWKSVCTECGQKNFGSTNENGCRCGRCGKNTRVDYKDPQSFMQASGISIDMDEDFEDWSIEEIIERVKLVQEFDLLCDKVAETAVWMADNFDIGEEEMMIPKRIRVLKMKGSLNA